MKKLRPYFILKRMEEMGIKEGDCLKMGLSKENIRVAVLKNRCSTNEIIKLALLLGVKISDLYI